MTPPSRSSVYIEALWQNGEALARPGWSMSVSPTRLYSGGNLVDELWAGLSGINISGGVGPNNSFAYANISHVVANPYCVGGQIAYQVNAAFWPTGYTEVNGTRLPVPNHEGYIRTSLNGANWNAWSTVHQMTNQGFHCLLGTCGFETISFGGYPS